MAFSHTLEEHVQMVYLLIREFNLHKMNNFKSIFKKLNNFIVITRNLQWLYFIELQLYRNQWNKWKAEDRVVFKSHRNWIES